MVCHCKTCVAYPGMLGKADRVLDEHGGSDVFQMAPADFTLDEGLEHLACLRMTRKGALRWYASCCDTPLANTLSGPGWPFIGVYPMILQRPEGEPLEALLGPVLARINGHFPAARARRIRATRLALLTMLLGLLWMTLRWRLAGRHGPLMFFDPKTRAPIREPELRHGP